VVEIKNIMIKSLYIWTTTYNSPHLFGFSEFLDFCSSFSPFSGFLLYSFCVLGLRSSALSNKINYL
jgi:hypothetical protein